MYLLFETSPDFFFFFFGGGGGGGEAPMYLLLGDIYWFLGRRGYLGVSNVALVFIYSETLYPLSREEFNKNSSSSHSKYSLHSRLVSYDAGQMQHWWGSLWTTLCFPVTTQPDWLMCIRGKHSWSVTPFSAWSAYPYPSTTFVFKGYLSKLCHYGCDDKESVKGPKCTN